MLSQPVSIPRLAMRPSQPQIIVIPQSIFSKGGQKNNLSFTVGGYQGPFVTRVVRPQVGIVKKADDGTLQPTKVSLKRSLPVSSGN